MLILMISTLFLSVWMISLSPSVSLLTLSGLAISYALSISLYSSVSNIPLFMMILSILGGLFILIAMILLMSPKDYNVTAKSVGFWGGLYVWFIFQMCCNSNFLNPLEIEFFSMGDYSYSFLFSMNILFLSLFIIDWILSKLGKGHVFKN